MKTRKPKPESEQSIPEMVEDVTREEMRQMYKDGKLTPHGRQMAKLLDRALPAAMRPFKCREPWLRPDAVKVRMWYNFNGEKGECHDFARGNNDRRERRAGV